MECIINATKIRNQIAELGLKQWWLADQLRVNRKTVSRWLNGTVRRTSLETATELAGILKCDLETITVEEESDLFATPNDQKQAAELLKSSSVIDKLGPLGEWEVIEALLKANLIPQLPKLTLAEAFNNLSIACWRQSKIPEAKVYAQKAQAIGEAIEDHSILAHARLNLANIYSWEGKMQQSIDTYHECLAHKSHMEPRQLGSVHNNLGAVLWEAGNWKAAKVHVEKALKIFSQHGKPMNMSIAHTQMCLGFLEDEDRQKAQFHQEQSRSFAEKGEYKRGIQICILLQAEIDACLGNAEEASLGVESALSGFLNLEIMEGLNYEIAARTHRILKGFATALSLIKQGLEVSKDFPVATAALLAEEGRTLMAMGLETEATASFKASAKLYERCQSPLRATMLLKP